MLPELIDDLEQSGLVYFDDFFELSGNWPDWLPCMRGARPRDLESLLDDGPLLDEGNAVLDSVDHDLRTGGDDRQTE